MRSSGEHYAAESAANQGEWYVMRRNLESPGSWDMCVLAGLPEETAEKIAALLSEV